MAIENGVNKSKDPDEIMESNSIKERLDEVNKQLEQEAKPGNDGSNDQSNTTPETVTVEDSLCQSEMGKLVQEKL